MVQSSKFIAVIRQDGYDRFRARNETSELQKKSKNLKIISGRAPTKYPHNVPILFFGEGSSFLSDSKICFNDNILKYLTHVTASISVDTLAKSISVGLINRALYATLLPMYNTGKSTRGK